MYNYLFYRTREKDVAEDLVSATFFKAITHLDGFDGRKGNFSAWLYRIARNTLFDYQRAKKPTNPLEDAEAILADSHVERDAINRELVRKVKDLFVQLPKEQQEIFTMRVWDDLSYAAISEIVNKSEASCRMTFHRAVAKLKELAPLAIGFFILLSIK
jgi:RNA polymerase sigma-70 factor (ECF subfamily)